MYCCFIDISLNTRTIREYFYNETICFTLLEQQDCNYIVVVAIYVVLQQPVMHQRVRSYIWIFHKTDRKLCKHYYQLIKMYGLAYQTIDAIIVITLEVMKITNLKLRGVPSNILEIDEARYKPHATLLHIGQNMISGHYIACQWPASSLDKSVRALTLYTRKLLYLMNAQWSDEMFGFKSILYA
ncbi:ubiquitin carboxyl-terminal hydrolase 25-like [Aphis craccivora]|uniref:Ubiquitin carboxyl-terminal hydrolase 25-like n=1 Tax=Aphis craccivora TaxID=307492 RepID=A0A6G0Y1P8_APHCR|nr:ubiquitin carboxyl-terminal hydrolase 25-like [Aphis craccivora]